MPSTPPAGQRSVFVSLHIVSLQPRAGQITCPLEGCQFVVDTFRKARPLRGKYCAVWLLVLHSLAPDSLFSGEMARTHSSRSDLDSASNLEDNFSSCLAILFSKSPSKSSTSPSIAISFSGSLSLCARLFRFNHRFDISSTAKRSFSCSSIAVIPPSAPKRRARGAITRVPKAAQAFLHSSLVCGEDIRRARKRSVTTVTRSP